MGDGFGFYRDNIRDDFWHMGLHTPGKATGAQIQLQEPPNARLPRGMACRAALSAKEKALPRPSCQAAWEAVIMGERIGKEKAHGKWI